MKQESISTTQQNKIITAKTRRNEIFVEDAEYDKEIGVLKAQTDLAFGDKPVAEELVFKGSSVQEVSNKYRTRQNPSYIPIEEKETIIVKQTTSGAKVVKAKPEEAEKINNVVIGRLSEKERVVATEMLARGEDLTIGKTGKGDSALYTIVDKVNQELTANSGIYIIKQNPTSQEDISRMLEARSVDDNPKLTQHITNFHMRAHEIKADYTKYLKERKANNDWMAQPLVIKINEKIAEINSIPRYIMGVRTPDMLPIHIPQTLLWLGFSKELKTVEINTRKYIVRDLQLEELSNANVAKKIKMCYSTAGIEEHFLQQQFANLNVEDQIGISDWLDNGIHDTGTAEGLLQRHMQLLDVHLKAVKSTLKGVPPGLLSLAPSNYQRLTNMHHDVSLREYLFSYFEGATNPLDVIFAGAFANIPNPQKLTMHAIMTSVYMAPDGSDNLAISINNHAKGILGCKETRASTALDEIVKGYELFRTLATTNYTNEERDAIFCVHGMKGKLEVRKQDKKPRTFCPSSMPNGIIEQWLLNSFFTHMRNFQTGHLKSLIGITSSKGGFAQVWTYLLNSKANTYICYSDNVYYRDAAGKIYSGDFPKMEAGTLLCNMYGTLKMAARHMLTPEDYTLMMIKLEHTYMGNRHVVFSFDGMTALKMGHQQLPSGYPGTTDYNQCCSEMSIFILDFLKIPLFMDGEITPEAQAILEAFGMVPEVESYIQIDYIDGDIIKSDLLGNSLVCVSKQENIFIPVLDPVRMLRAVTFSKTALTAEPIIKSVVKFLKFKSLAPQTFYNEKLMEAMYNYTFLLGVTQKNFINDDTLTSEAITTVYDTLMDSQMTSEMVLSELKTISPILPQEYIRRVSSEQNILPAIKLSEKLFPHIVFLNKTMSPFTFSLANSYGLINRAVNYAKTLQYQMEQKQRSLMVYLEDSNSDTAIRKFIAKVKTTGVINSGTLNPVLRNLTLGNIELTAFVITSYTNSKLKRYKASRGLKHINLTQYMNTLCTVIKDLGLGGKVEFEDRMSQELLKEMNRLREKGKKPMQSLMESLRSLGNRNHKEGVKILKDFDPVLNVNYGANGVELQFMLPEPRSLNSVAFDDDKIAAIKTFMENLVIGAFVRLEDYVSLKDTKSTTPISRIALAKLIAYPILVQDLSGVTLTKILSVLEEPDYNLHGMTLEIKLNNASFSFSPEKIVGLLDQPLTPLTPLFEFVKNGKIDYDAVYNSLYEEKDTPTLVLELFQTAISADVICSGETHSSITAFLKNNNYPTNRNVWIAMAMIDYLTTYRELEIGEVAKSKLMWMAAVNNPFINYALWSMLAAYYSPGSYGLEEVGFYMRIVKEGIGTMLPAVTYNGKLRPYITTTKAEVVKNRLSDKRSEARQNMSETIMVNTTLSKLAEYKEQDDEAVFKIADEMAFKEMEVRKRNILENEVWQDYGDQFAKKEAIKEAEKKEERVWEMAREMQGLVKAKSLGPSKLKKREKSVYLPEEKKLSKNYKGKAKIITEFTYDNYRINGHLQPAFIEKIKNTRSNIRGGFSKTEMERFAPSPLLDPDVKYYYGFGFSAPDHDMTTPEQYGVFYSLNLFTRLFPDSQSALNARHGFAMDQDLSKYKYSYDDLKDIEVQRLENDASDPKIVVYICAFSLYTHIIVAKKQAVVSYHINRTNCVRCSLANSITGTHQTLGFKKCSMEQHSAHWYKPEVGKRVFVLSSRNLFTLYASLVSDDFVRNGPFHISFGKRIIGGFMYGEYNGVESITFTETKPDWVFPLDMYADSIILRTPITQTFRLRFTPPSIYSYEVFKKYLLKNIIKHSVTINHLFELMFSNGDHLFYHQMFEELSDFMSMRMETAPNTMSLGYIIVFFDYMIDKFMFNDTAEKF